MLIIQSMVINHLDELVKLGVGYAFWEPEGYEVNDSVEGRFPPCLGLVIWLE